MRYTTKTEYGVVCMMALARSGGPASLMTIKELAKKENYPVAYIEKIFQALRQAKLVVSHQGTQGGYELARPASQITMKDIIEALEGSTFETFCDPHVREELVCNHICMCGAKPVWKKTKDLLDNFFESVTLETLTKGQVEVQHRLTDLSPKTHLGPGPVVL